MITPFVSVHMIVKENTHLGEEFLNGAFTSLYESAYPNEIILIDNGCQNFINDNILEPWKNKFKNIDCDLRITKSDLVKFCDLRNLCLEKTNTSSNFIMWHDSDEIYYPEDLDILKNYIMPEYPSAGTIWTYFYHFMVHPFQIQVDVEAVKQKIPLTLDLCRISKDNIFGYNRGMVWKGDVHEHLFNLRNETTVQSNVEYLHYGYCRNQWRIMAKWLRYALLEHNTIGMYKDEVIEVEENGQKVNKTVEHLRDWRNPDNIVWDRREYSRPYPFKEVGTRDYLPEGAKLLIGNCKNEEDWINHINTIDNNEFWLRWQDKFKEVGSWKNTLDWAVEELQKNNWKEAW